MSVAADNLQPISGKRLFKKTREEELRFPVLSDPLLRMAEPLANEKANNWLVTFPHPKQMQNSEGILLAPPSQFSKQQILDKVQDCLARPDSRNPAVAQPPPIPVQRCGCWREMHREDESGQANPHDHVALSTGTSFRYLPVKRALLVRHGLATHWSRHHGYSTMVRYLAIPSEKKPKNTLDPWPALWDCSGTHFPLIDSISPPVTQKALETKRMKLMQEAAENGTAEPKVNDLDIMALVVRTGIKNTPDTRDAWMQLVSYAKENCGEATYHYLWKRRHILSSMLDEIWLWENISEHAAASMLSRIETVNKSRKTPCVCHGEWLALVTDSFVKNGIEVQALCRDVWRALRDGRGETTPVVVLAGLTGGEGKSLFLKALVEIFGSAFNMTRESGNFPLIDLPLAKIAFLDDYRFDPEVLSWSTTCLWFDGSSVPIGKPQNERGATPGNFMYKGSAPIFVTTKLSDLAWLENRASINPRTNAPWDADASMLLRRLRVYRFTQRVNKPPARLKYCPRCFLDLVMAQAGEE